MRVFFVLMPAGMQMVIGGMRLVTGERAKNAFRTGVREITDYIRSKGMIPGVWLELEVMGINCHMAQEVPDDWFFHASWKTCI